MKRILLIALVLLTFSLSAQEKIVNIGVIPTPQKVELDSGFCHFGEQKCMLLDCTNREPSARQIAKMEKKERVVILEHRVDSIEGTLHQGQSYRLVLKPWLIYLYYTGKEGYNYAYRTLSQLRDFYGDGKIPCITITDWPAYEYRGWLDDISRGPIPNDDFKTDTRYFCYDFKMNFGSYYTEHTLYNPQYPDISATSGLKPYIIQWMNKWDSCYMMANLQCFAHFEKTLRIPFYQDMMDGNANLDPSNEKSYDFLRNQISNCLSAYPHTKFLNINCDETEGLGIGRARKYVDEVGADEAYCRHINRVYDIIQEEYRHQHDSNAMLDVLMWGDIVAKNPDMLYHLPQKMQYIIWSYVAKESYADMIAPFKEIHQRQGNEFWVAPGVSHWSSTPQVKNYMQNIAFLARDGYLAGAKGLMNTAWDDSGESLFGDCWHAMAWASEMAWHPITATDPKEALQELAERERIFNANYDHYYTVNRPSDGDTLQPKEDIKITDMIYAVGLLNENKWVGDWFNTAALMQPLLEFYPYNVSREMLQRCDKVEHIVKQVMEKIDSAVVPHFYYACHRILCVAEKSRLRVMYYQHDPAAKIVAQQYFQHLHNLKREYLRLWDEESTDYSRDIICQRYDDLGREVLEAEQHVFAEGRSLKAVRPTDKADIQEISLSTLFDDKDIFYTLDGRKPSKGATKYSGPFTIDRSCLVKAVTFDPWGEPFYSEQYLLCHKALGNITRLNTNYSDYNVTYSAGGDGALADGILGSDNNYADGHWQGYWGQDIDVEMNFGSVKSVNSITMRFLQNSINWILAPETIELYTSKDGQNWTLLRTEKFNPDYRITGNIIFTDPINNLNANTQYLRVVVKNPGILPDWHPSKGNASYLFCDEIVVE